MHSPHGSIFMPFRLQVLDVGFVYQDMGERIRVDCSVRAIVTDVDKGGERTMSFAHYIDWDRPETDEGWALLEAEAYAEAIRFVVAHELAETVRDANGDAYVDPHPGVMKVGCWERPMQSLEYGFAARRGDS